MDMHFVNEGPNFSILLSSLTYPSLMAAPIMYFRNTSFNRRHLLWRVDWYLIDEDSLDRLELVRNTSTSETSPLAGYLL